MSRVSLETLLSRSNRNMGEGTHPVVRESALEVVKRAYKEGINAQISEGHRSNARQNELYAQGRTKPGNRVTNARAGYSWHNYGIAVDYFLTTKDGNRAVWSVTKEWRRVAQIAKSLGFEWGGDWTGFVDYPHLQMTGGLTMAQMRSGQKPTLVSRVDKPVKQQTSKPTPAPSKIKWQKVTGNWNGQPIYKGMYGTPVLQVQQLLASNYYFPEKGAKLDGVDGEFGDKTEDAVKRYQGMHGLEVDGVAGKDTFASLQGKPVPQMKPVKEIAQEVNAGKWGNNPERARKLEEAGYNATQVQNEVNKLVKSKTKSKVRKLHLPVTAKTWRIYRVGGTYRKGHELHMLTPSAFPGGITYEIKQNLGGNMYAIDISQSLANKIGSSRRVAIYAHPNTGARIT